MKLLKAKKVVIVTHVFATGPAQELEEFLKDKVEELLFIGHPFAYARNTRSFYKRYKQGVLCEEHYAFDWKLPEFLCWGKDICYTLFWIFRYGGTFHLYVGANNLNTFIGLLLKKMRKVSQVVFYTVDYVPNRFHNELLNNIYHRIDRFCVRYCDRIWNLSENMTKKRREKGISDYRQLVVPIGVHLNAGMFEESRDERAGNMKLAYMGHLRKGQGLELIIEAMPEAVKRLPELKLIIIGMGKLKDFLERSARKSGIAGNVEFSGYIKDYKEVEKILSTCTVGLAPYEPNPDSFTWYADPSKPKQYMACGLPVVITKVPGIAQDIETRQMGVVIDYKKSELVEAITKLLNDREFYLRCKRNALEFSTHLTWDSIFEKAFSQTLSG